MSEQRDLFPLPLRAISVQQPWADALVDGRKCVENRGRRISHRGDVAIQASRVLDDDERAARLCGPYLGGPARQGVILGVVELFDVVDHLDDPWFCGPWGWLVRNPRRLATPIPCRGQLSLWTIPPEIETLIKEQLQ